MYKAKQFLLINNKKILLILVDLNNHMQGRGYEIFQFREWGGCPLGFPLNFLEWGLLTRFYTGDVHPSPPPPHTALLNSHLPNISYFRNIKGFHHPGFIDIVIRIVEFVIIAHLLQ